jgi:hypothetical protein
MSEMPATKAAKDWHWWTTSPYAEASTVRECIREAQARIAELEGELERAKVCGSCAHWGPVLFECTLVSVHDLQRPWSGECYNLDPCHFTPSRWTACGEERSE